MKKYTGIAANRIGMMIPNTHTPMKLIRPLYFLWLNPKVWKALLEIPYGKTVSYLDISKQLGDVKAIRAVASANGKNPLWIVIPCHRVIGSDGSLTGYAGGMSRKAHLLQLERNGSKTPPNVL